MSDLAELIERLETHMGKQDVAVLLSDCRKAAEALRELQEALEPFATAAERYGLRYLALPEQEIRAHPELNLPHNYARAVMSAAEQTGWNVWENAIHAYRAAALAQPKEGQAA